MQVTASAVTLTVDDVDASRRYLTTHFGFAELVATDGFASLCRDDAVNVVLLRRGTDVLPEGLRDQRASGVIIALTVTDLPGEYERLRAEGVPITLPWHEDPWGERLFQVTDPNGIIVQLLDWVAPAPEWKGPLPANSPR